MNLIIGSRNLRPPIQNRLTYALNKRDAKFDTFIKH